MVANGLNRTTMDVDLLIDASPENVTTLDELKTLFGSVRDYTHVLFAIIDRTRA